MVATALQYKLKAIGSQVNPQAAKLAKIQYSLS